MDTFSRVNKALAKYGVDRDGKEQYYNPSSGASIKLESAYVDVEVNNLQIIHACNLCLTQCSIWVK